MELDARNLAPEAVLEAEVCVVGSGPAGLTLGLELGRGGRRVLVIESGSLGNDPAAQSLNRGVVIGGPYHPLEHTRHRQVGGTTRLWNTSFENIAGMAKYVPLDRNDFETQDGWPFGFEHIEPFYQRAQSYCGLGPFQWEAAQWHVPDHEPPPLGDALCARVYQFGPGTLWTQQAPAEIRTMPNVLLLTSGTATRLVPAADDTRIERVTVSTDSAQLSVRADHIVIAAGALENARLLLVSAQYARALALPQLGRGFMEHPRDYAPVLITDHRSSLRLLRFFDAHRATDRTIIGGRIAPGDGLLDDDLPSFSVTLFPRNLGSRHERLKHRWFGRPVPQPSYGWSARPPQRGWNGFRLVVNLEQRSDPANRVTLGGEHDRLGVPLPILHWTWTKGAQTQLERIRGQLREHFRAAGLGRLEWPEGVPPDPNAHHHAGTTRMHPHPDHGVVDANCRVHGFENLWIAGASVFPRAGFANPTLTVVAMAIRLAERLLHTS